MIEWIKKLCETPRGKAAFKLSLYMIFILFVLLIIFIGGSFNDKTVTEKQESSTTEKESTITEITFLEKQSKLLNEDYDFKYIITGEYTINYEGEKNFSIIKGYKQSKDELIRFEIENGITYKSFFTYREEYPNLYENLDNRLFDLTLLFNTLNQSTATIIKNNIEKIYNYTNIFDDYIIEVKTDNCKITNISIKNNTLEYNFAFEYKIKENN